jgi:hypothetical protein
LAEETAIGKLNEALEPIFEQLQVLPRVLGIISMQLLVSGQTGLVTEVKFLADTLVALPAAAGVELGGGLLGASTIRGAVQHTIRDGLMAAHFPPCAEGDTIITLPLVFD